jgi:hypothetical protein
LREHCDVAAGPGVEGDSGAADRDRVALVWTGMLVAQLEVEPAEALVRLRAHAFATGRSATAVACDILDRRLRLEAD